MRARNLALPAVVLCLAFAACDDDDPRSPGAGSPGVAGVSMNFPSLEGSWVLTSTSANGTCGPLNRTLETVTVLTIFQAGSDFNFTLADDCGNPIPGGTGSVDQSGALTFSAQTTEPLTPTCTLQLAATWAGLLRTSPDVINGANTLNIAASPLPGQNICGPGLPCSESSSFTAEPCPRSGCVVTCTP